MCSYYGKEMVELARLIAAKTADLRELILDDACRVQATMVPGQYSAAKSVLERSGDFVSLEVLELLSPRKKEALDDPVRICLD
jgi:hypothetical protein